MQTSEWGQISFHDTKAPTLSETRLWDKPVSFRVAFLWHSRTGRAVLVPREAGSGRAAREAGRGSLCPGVEVTVSYLLTLLRSQGGGCQRHLHVCQDAARLLRLLSFTHRFHEGDLPMGS